MYIPPPFRVQDAGKLATFLRQHSFATLITHDGTAPFATHLPVLFRPEVDPHGMLVAHLARANPQWQHFSTGAEVLAIFHGPHGYVSPSWYPSGPDAPTWNDAVVHAYGTPRIFGEPARVVALLEETVSVYESAFAQPWDSSRLPAEYRERLTGGVVAFEIPITRIEGKFKLSQNRSEADIQGVCDGLATVGNADALALRRMMRTEGG